MKELVTAAAFHLYTRLKLVGATDCSGALAEDGLPVPPPALIFSVAGTPRADHFLDGGRKAERAIRGALSRHGIALEDALPLLDFGCGCGRVSRRWAALPAGSVYGVDINGPAVAWSREHLTFGTFGANRLDPHLDFADGQFGLIYALSVFTHLPEAAGYAWLEELRRLLRPGGLLVVSTHGEACLRRLTRSERDRFRRGELVEHFGWAPGSNLCCIYHPETFIREQFARGWELLEIEPSGALGNSPQDQMLLRKPQRS